MSKLMDLMDAWVENHGGEIRVPTKLIFEFTEMVNTPPAAPVKEYKSEYYRQCIEERQRKHDEEELLKSLWAPEPMQCQHTEKRSLRDSFTIKI